MEYNDLDIRPAIRENVGLFIAICGPSTSGKTWSAMEIAKGIVGPGEKFGFVDTENRRSRHYADDFNFDVMDLSAPYNAHHYQVAVERMFKKGYKAIVVDSASHEHEGEGGYLDQQEAILKDRVDRYLAGNPNVPRWKAEEKFTPTSWTAAKKERKRMILSLLAYSSTTPIIFCFRAEEKVFKSVDGKLIAQNPPVWTPSTGKSIPYEMTVSLMLDPERSGYILKVLKMAEKLKHMFPLDKRLGPDCGRQIAEWAKGKEGKPPQPAPKVDPAVTAAVPSNPSPEADPNVATPRQVNDLLDLIEVKAVPRKTLDLWLKGGTWETMRSDRIQWCIDALKKMADK